MLQCVYYHWVNLFHHEVFMKILFISGTFPPDTSATAIVLDKILHVFENRGIVVDALTLKATFKQKDFQVYRNANIYRTDAVKFISHPIRCFKDFTQGIKNKLRLFLKIRDGNLLYRESIVKKLGKKLSILPLDSYDAVIAVCAYYEAAEVIKRYRKLFPSHTKVLFYQLDPLSTQALREAIGEEYLSNFEKELYAACDCILTTPNIYHEQQIKGSPLDKLIPLEQPLGEKHMYLPIEKSPDEIRCVFSGEFYGNIRDASFMLEVFSRCKSPNLHLYVIGGGQEKLMQKYAQTSLNGRLHLLGRLPSSVCNQWLASADILVNIGNREIIYVPSKLFHYLSFGKPILNLIENTNCPTTKYLKRYPLAKTLIKNIISDSDINETEQWIAKSIGEKLPYEQVEMLYPTFTPQYIANQIIQAIQNTDHNEDNA